MAETPRVRNGAQAGENERKNSLRSLIALLTLRGLRYKIFLRDALFSPQMPAASPKLFACYVTVGDTQTCALKVAKILSDDPVRVAPTKRSRARMTARLTKELRPT